MWKGINFNIVRPTRESVISVERSLETGGRLITILLLCAIVMEELLDVLNMAIFVGTVSKIFILGTQVHPFTHIIVPNAMSLLESGKASIKKYDYRY